MLFRSKQVQMDQLSDDEIDTMIEKSFLEHGIETVGGYESYAPYAVPEEELKAVGYDVLVFVPSQDEEHGLVTCGNLILGGSQFRQFEDGLKIIGQPTTNTWGGE